MIEASKVSASNEIGSWMQFFSSRWRGQVSSQTLLVRDIFALGTVLNLVAGFVMLLALANDRTSYDLLSHFVLLPYNLFLVTCFWRTPNKSALGSAAAGIWFALMTIL